MPKTLGDKRHDALVAYIKTCRLAAGLNQAEVAQRLGVYQSHVARIESGQRRIDVIELIRLGEALGFDPAEAVRNLSELKA
ncbi:MULTISPECIES: helix-turn-helix domain-containing protein [Thalassovita]|uniref:Helix-turn-helix n=2 Tax=Thalassovita TaxID=335927 RepID=A0A1H9JRR7_9RHOB|nr:MULTISPECIES: helix-turn-helix transcriptional regulator [Thalassovita]MYM54819.1 helix-turn-helix domain-containing protein [Thalassovita mangrovi]SEQ89537.1 Helix-turn-helix [Thalassovita taeanensis]